MKKPKLVHIEWLDACNGDPGWKTLESHGEYMKPLPVESIGYEVKSDKDCLVLAPHFYTVNDNHIFTGEMVIPRRNIKRRRIVRL